MFSDNLKALRARKGLSQAELARRLTVSQQTVAKWETNKSTPNPSTILKLAEIFGVSTDEILGNEIEKDVKNDKIYTLQRAADKGMTESELEDILSYAKFRYPERFKKD